MMRPWRTCTARDGFTIIELVVVVAIIGVLLALSIPVLQYGIERAQSSTCMSNQHEIYVALHQYADENNGQLPGMLPLRVSSGDSGPTMDTVLTPYVTDPSIFHCPADKTLFAESGCSYLWVYGYSVNAQGQQNTSLVAPSFPLTGQTSPSLIPFLSDKQSFHPINPTTHILYADGHVQ